MKIEIRDCCLRDVSYTAAHALEIDRQEILACGPNTMFEAACLTWSMLQANGGIAYTGFRDGNPELVCGFTRQSAITPWLFSAWMWSTKNALPCIPALVRHCRKELWARLVEDLGATRTEARSHIGHLNAHRFLKGIGFVRETDLVDYGRDRARFVLFAMRLSDFEVKMPKKDEMKDVHQGSGWARNRTYTVEEGMVRAQIQADEELLENYVDEDQPVGTGLGSEAKTHFQMPRGKK